MPASASVPVFRNRPDTFFGVCEAIGQDFGFNANILRVAFALMVLASPVAVVAAYAALGVVVALSRALVPVGTHVLGKAGEAVLPAAVNDAEDRVFADAA